MDCNTFPRFRLRPGGNVLHGDAIEHSGYRSAGYGSGQPALKVTNLFMIDNAIDTATIVTAGQRVPNPDIR